MTTALAWTPRSLAAAITAFAARTRRDEYTDTGDALDLLQAARDLLRAPAAPVPVLVVISGGVLASCVTMPGSPACVYLRDFDDLAASGITGTPAECAPPILIHGAGPLPPPHEFSRPRHRCVCGPAFEVGPLAHHCYACHGVLLTADR